MDMQKFMVSLYSRPKEGQVVLVYSENGFLKWELGISPTSSGNPSQAAGHIAWQLVIVRILFLAPYIFFKYNLVCRGSALFPTSSLVASYSSNFKPLVMKSEISPFRGRAFV